MRNAAAATTVLLLSLAATARSAVERQTNLSPHTRTVTSEVAEGARILTNAPPFREAALFRRDDGTHLLSLDLDGEGTYHRRTVSDEELYVLRNRLHAYFTTGEGAHSKESWLLIPTSVLAAGLSFGYYGWAFPTAVGLENNTKAYVFSEMISGTIGLGAGYLLYRHTDLSRDHVYGMYQGATRGIAWGINIAWWAAMDDKQTLGTGIVTSLAWGYLGHRLVSWTGADQPIMSVSDDFGWLGYLPAMAIAWEETTVTIVTERPGGGEEKELVPIEGPEPRLAGAIGTFSTLIASAGGWWLASTLDLDYGGALAGTFAGGLGMHLGLCIGLIGELESQAMWGTMAITAPAAETAVLIWMRGKELSYGWGILSGVIAGTAGAFVFGTLYLILPEEDEWDDPQDYGKVMNTGALLGEAAGLILSLHFLADRRTQRTSLPRIELNPTAALLPLLRCPSEPIPVLTVRF